MQAQMGAGMRGDARRLGVLVVLRGPRWARVVFCAFLARAAVGGLDDRPRLCFVLNGA